MCGQGLSSGLFCCPDLLLSAPTALRIPEKALRGSLEPEPGQIRILNRSSPGGGGGSSQIKILTLSGSGRDPLAHFVLENSPKQRCVVLRWFLPALENSPKPVEVYQRILREKAKENAKASGENFGRGMNEKGLENSPKPIEAINVRKQTAEAPPDRDPLVTS